MTAGPLRIVTGDATYPQAQGPAVIAHVCNNAGRWDSGFVLAVSRRWPQAQRDYQNWYRAQAGASLPLGAVQLVPVQLVPVQKDDDLWVANMVGQHGTRPSVSGLPPIRYQALRQCLDILGTEAIALGASVHMPRIGCGLAGGSWDRIEPIISDALCERGIPVTVYDLEPS